MPISLATVTLSEIDDKMVDDLVLSGVMSRCGDCTACCTHLSIDYMEEFKPEHIDCKHLLISGGCEIYKNRPSGCKQFVCIWKSRPPVEMISEDKYQSLRPDRSGVIIYLRAGFLGDMNRPNVVAAETRIGAMNEPANQMYALQVAAQIESVVVVVPYDRVKRKLAGNIMIPALPYAESIERQIREYYAQVTGKKNNLKFATSKLGEMCHIGHPAT